MEKVDLFNMFKNGFTITVDSSDKTTTYAITSTGDTQLADELSGKGRNVTSNPIDNKNAIKVANKTRVGTKKTGFGYYLADNKGNVFKVDKTAYDAVSKGQSINLTGDMAKPVPTNALPEKVKSQFKKLLATPTNTQAGKEVAENAGNAVGKNTKNPNPSHPSNAILGNNPAQAPTEPLTWKKYYEEHGIKYEAPKKFGGIKADRQAEEIIRKNSQNATSTTIEKVFNPKTNKYDIKVGDKVIKSFYRESLADKYIEKYGVKLLKEAPLGVIDEKINPNPSHSSNTSLEERLANAEKEAKRNKTLAERYKALAESKEERLKAQRKGKKTGPAEADRQAEEIIRKNSQNATNTQAGDAIENGAKKANKTTVGKAFKNIPWKKIGKWGGLIALVGLAAVGVNSLIQNAKDKNQAVDQNSTTPVPATSIVEENDSIAVATDTIGNNETVVPPVVEQEVEEVDPNSPIDADGKATVQKGDGLWHIAERYLEYKHKNTPETFANLSEKEKNQMILKEVRRLAKLNGYEFVQKEINGKLQTVTSPMMHPVDKIQVEKKMDVAA